MSIEQLAQALVIGLSMGAMYALMAMGITFIASIMKIINWSMGDFYMMGSYLQYVLIIFIVGPAWWFLGIPVVMVVAFGVGLVVQRLFLAPMFYYDDAHKFQYATIMTIALSVLFQNGAVLLAGPNQFSPPNYLPSIPLPGLGIKINGSRLAAAMGAVVILTLFYWFLRNSRTGLALRGVAQNRVGALTAGVRLRQMDMIGFGIGVALAAAAGALLAPVFSVYAGNGVFSIVKGFEIIVIGGLGSLLGALIAAFLLALTESFGSIFISPLYQELYGFMFLILFLVFRPQGMFGEKERRV